jgi:DEAD/DEAH box helicase domain-containing protein
VTTLDLEERKVWVEPSDGSTYTRALSEKETSILSRERTRPAGGFRLCQGRVKVTTRVTAYERRRVRGQELLGTEALDLPPTSFETSSLWLEIPDEIPQALSHAERHVMGSLHAVEHAALSSSRSSCSATASTSPASPTGTTPSWAAQRSSSTTVTRAGWGW